MLVGNVLLILCMPKVSMYHYSFVGCKEAWNIQLYGINMCRTLWKILTPLKAEHLLAPDRLIVPVMMNLYQVDWVLSGVRFLKSCCEWQLARDGIERVHQIRGHICEKSYQSTSLIPWCLDVFVVLAEALYALVVVVLAEALYALVDV